MRHLLLLIAFLLPAFIYAQGEDYIVETKESTPSPKVLDVLPLLPLPSTISLEDGQELDKNEARYETEILLSDSSGFYGASTASSIFFLKSTAYFFYCDNKMNLIKKEEVKFELDDKKTAFVTIRVLKGVIYVFTAEYDLKGKEKEVRLYAQSLNKNTLQLNNDLKKIADIDYYEYRDSYNSMIYSSKDESKLLVCYKKQLKDSDNEKSFNAIVLDNNLNKLWERSISLPYPKKLYIYQSVQVDNQGTVYFKGLLYNNNLERTDNDGKPNYNTVIAFCKEGGADIGEFKIPNGGRYISNVSIMPMPNSGLICTGFYKEKFNLYKNVGFKGIFYIQTNLEAKKIEVETYKELDKSFFDKFSTSNSFDINVQSDGSMMLVVEKATGVTNTYTVTQKMDVSTPSMSPGTAVVSTTSTASSSTFYARDILVTKVNKKGEFEWVTNISKYERSPNTSRGLSFAYLITKGKTYLVYNDHPKNLTRKEDVKRSNGAIVTLVEINNTDGTWNKYKLYSNKENHTQTHPMSSKLINGNQLMLYRNHYSKFKYTRVTFK